MRRRVLALSLGLVAAAATTAAVVVTAPSAFAATGCSVSYSVASQWPGGFGANVTIKNLGDPISSWTLVWSYSAGQQVTQYWNATVTQSGSQVTANNVSYNGSLGTNATTSFGFNGSWNNSSNPVPSSFTLNGTNCTGSVTSAPSPSASRTSARPSASASPTRSASPTPSTSSAGGVPSDAAWVATGSFDSWTNNGYTLNNDVWGGGAGPQTIWARTGTNWGVVSNQPRTSGVKSYPHTGKTLNRTLSSLASVSSSLNVSVPSDGDYETAYDIWANNNAFEVMLWVNEKGAVGPIAQSYDANGAVPSATNVSAGGNTWNVFKGSNGSNQVFSFVRTSTTNSATIDVLSVLKWLQTQGWWGDVNVSEIQFGFEISGTAGQSNFVCNTFSINFS